MTYRQPSREARHVRELVFDKLPSVVRERLATALAEGGAPAPLLVDRAWQTLPSARRWRVFAGAAAVAEVALWFKGFGDVASPLALQPPAFAAVHVALVFAVLFGLLRAARMARGHGAPFPDGRYLFALDLVEVDGARIRLTDLHTLRRVEVRPAKYLPSIALVFADGHEVLFRTQARAEDHAASVKEAAFAAAALSLRDDLPRLERLDPFFELRVADDWASAEAGAKDRRSLVARAPLPALGAATLAAAALAGLGLHALRNRLSDDEMFAQAIDIPGGSAPEARFHVRPYAGARHADEIDALRLDRASGNEDALQAYLQHPGARKAEAEAALLAFWKSDPIALNAAIRRGGVRAEQAAQVLFETQKDDRYALAEYIRKRGRYAERADEQLFALAQKSGSPALYRYYVEHGKRHVDEVQSTLLPEAAYLEAKKGDDVTLLDNFLRAYPDSAHVEEIKARVHACYAEALAAYRARNPSPAGLRFVTALLAELEDRADPSVSVEISIGDAHAIADADAKLAPRYGGSYLHAIYDFDPESRGFLEEQIHAALAAHLRAAFPHGTLRPTGPGLGAETGRPSVSLLCDLLVTGAILSPRDSDQYADVRLHVDFHAAVPARAQELAWTFTTPGIDAFDATPASPAMDPDLKHSALSQISYVRMKTAARVQVVERVQSDL